MNRIVLITALLGLAGSFSAQTLSKPPAEDSRGRQQGIETIFNQFTSDHDARRAQGALQDAIAQHPDDALPKYYLGVIAEWQENWTEASRWLTEFSTQAPSSPLASQAKTELIKLSALVHSDATPDGKKAREYAEAITNARLLLRTHFEKEAVAEANAAAQLKPDGWESYVIAAAALRNQKYLDESEGFLKKALTYAPDAQKQTIQKLLAQYPKAKEALALATQGKQLLDAQKYTDAASKYLAAANDDPSERDSYTLVAAFAYVLARDYASSTALLSQLRSSQDISVAHKARETLAKIQASGVASIPVHPSDTHAAAASGLQEQGQEGAEVELRKAIAGEPNNPEWHRQLATFLASQKRWAEAEAEFRATATLDPANPDVWSGIGTCAMQQRKWDEAIAAYKLAVAHNEKSAKFHDLLGSAYFYADDIKDSVAEFQVAAQLDPSSNSYKDHLKAATAKDQARLR